METRRCDCCQQEINFDENIPCFLDSCNHTIRMKCIDFKALENEVESNYFNIECPFCKKKQEFNLKIQTSLFQILKDVHCQSIKN